MVCADWSAYLDWRGGLNVLPALRQRAELMKYLQMGVRSACRDKPDVVYIPRKQVLLYSYCPRAFAWLAKWLCSC